MTPQNVLDAATVIAQAGSAVLVLVQLAKMLGFNDDRARVVVASVAGTGLTILYAFSNSLITGPNAFGIVIASVVVTATGAGIYGAATAVVKPQPNP